ncbi:MAG TPA: LamG domain-containing protein, partial [Pyrinomonadaceae bacterium]
MSFLLAAIFFGSVFFQAIQTFGLGTCVPAPVGLVAWYPGDGNALDIRGGNNGVPRSSLTYAQGKVGQAFQFSSSNGSANTQVNVADSPALRLLNALTIDAWINPTAPGAPDNPILVKGDLSSAGSQPYSILFVNAAINDNRIIFRVGNNSTFDSLISNANIPLNAYTHIAVTYDGVTMTLYINGVFDASKTTSIGTLNQNPLPLAIGGGAADFNGAVDELSIYNRALSASDIQLIFNNSSPSGKCKPTATVAPGGQTAWFAGDGNANDISGNGNNGTLDGATFAVGKVGQAFRFNGNGSRVLVGNAANLQLQTFTIEGWVKRASSTIVTNNPSDTAYGLIFAYGQGGYGIGIQPDGRLFSTKFGGLITNSALMITDTNYHHVSVTVSGTSLLFYVDGVGESQTISSQTYTFNTNAAIGARGDDVLNSFYGDIDELSIYNRVLSPSEIQSIANAGIAGKLKQTLTPTGFEALSKSSSTEDGLIS